MPRGETYLDYTGSTLYWNSQLEAALKVWPLQACGKQPERHARHSHARACGPCFVRLAARGLLAPAWSGRPCTLLSASSMTAAALGCLHGCLWVGSSKRVKLPPNPCPGPGGRGVWQPALGQPVVAAHRGQGGGAAGAPAALPGGRPRGVRCEGCRGASRQAPAAHFLAMLPLVLGQSPSCRMPRPLSRATRNKAR